MLSGWVRAVRADAEANHKEGAPTPTQGNDKAVQSRSFSSFLIVSISGFLVD
jgi:hypothetical protein